MVDLPLVTAVAAAQVPPLVFQDDIGRDPGPLSLVLSLGCAVALLARRRHPLLVLFAVGAVVPLVPPVLVALFVALYSVGVGAEVRREVGLAAYGVVATWVAIMQVVDDGAEGLVRGPVIALAMGFPLALGMAVLARRQLMAELVDRAERAEHEQQLLADAAVADERARLARELHDVVAHRVSLMVLHAGALELAAPLEQAETAGLVAGIGRQALEELREVLDVLRVDGSAAPRTPLPGLADVAELVEASRTAGTTVQVDEVGDLATLPGSVARTVFRVVQEALTNVHKHAPGAPVRILLERAPGCDMRVEVVNGPAPRLVAAPEAQVGGGHGLVGVRERVGLVGGQAEVGPTGDGGWAVRATLPAGAP